MATTHDLELSDLLEGGYAAHRFREQVMDDGLVLDYLIRPGPSTSRNAIALLRLMHYPDSCGFSKQCRRFSLNFVASGRV